MIIDIAIIVLVILITVIGIFRNPIKCAIDLVLFIVFTFIFYNVLVGVQDQIIGLTGYSISQIGEMHIGQSLESANNSLSNLAIQLEITILGINPDLTNDELYVQVGYAVVHSLFFVVSSILSVILAYGIGWGIYAIFRNKAKKINKLPRMLSSVGISLVFALTFITFTFSPIYMISNNATKINNYTENQNLENAVTFLNDTNDKAKSYETTLNDANTKLTTVNNEINSYESIIIDFDTSIYDLKKRYDDIGARIDTLSKKDLSASDRYAIEEVQKQYKTYETEINDSIATFESSKNDYYSLKTEINNYANQTTDVSQLLDTLSSLTTKVNQYYTQIKNIDGNYKQYLPSMFSFLGNINFGYVSFDSTATEISDLNEFFDLLDKNLDSLINNDLVKLVEEGNKKVNALVDTIEKYKSELDNFDSEYNKYKSQIDSEIEEGQSEIEKVSTELDKYEAELTKLEEKYS